MIKIESNGFTITYPRVKLSSETIYRKEMDSIQNKSTIHSAWVINAQENNFHSFMLIFLPYFVGMA